MKRKLLSVLLAVTILGGLTACGSSSKEEQTAAEENAAEETSEASEETKDELEEASDENVDELKKASEAEIDGELTISVGDHSSDEFVWKVALAKGFIDEEFDEDNITFNVETFSGGPTIYEAVAGGSLQFGIGSTDPIINYVSNGIDIKIISELEIGDKNMLIAVAKDSGIASLEDLEGKRVACSVGTFRHNFLLTALKTVNLTADDFELLNLQTSDIITALQAGEADAGVLSANNYANISDIADVLVYSDDYKTNYHVVGVDNAFAQKYPYTTARVIRLTKRAIDWIKENREESIQIFIDATGVEEAAAEIAYDTLAFGVELDTEGIISDTSATIQFSLENDIISNEIDAADLLDDTYIKLAGIEE